MAETSDLFYEGLRHHTTSLCTCWHLSPEFGPDLYFTNHDKKLTVGGLTFLPTASFSATAIAQREGAAVDNMNIVSLMSDEITDEDLLAGVWDNAKVAIYFVQWDNLAAGLHLIKRGTLGEIVVNETSYETEIRGYAEYLQREQGQAYTIECHAVFGDTRCGFPLDTVTFDREVLFSPDTRTFGITDSHDGGYYQYGTARFTTGRNAGRKVEVVGSQLLSSDPDNLRHRITILEKMPYPITRGDTVEMVRGCPNTFAGCKVRDNVLNFRGFKDMPTEAEAMESTAGKKGELK